MGVLGKKYHLFLFINLFWIPLFLPTFQDFMPVNFYRTAFLCLSKLHYLLFVKIICCLSEQLDVCQNNLLFVRITCRLSKQLAVCQNNLLFVRIICFLTK